VFDFTTPGQSLYGAHLQRQQSGNRFWRQKGAEIFPDCGFACLRHEKAYGIVCFFSGEEFSYFF